MPVPARLRREQHDVAAVGELGFRIYERVDEITIPVAPPEQNTVYYAVKVLIDELGALQGHDGITQRLVYVVVIANLLHHVAWLDAKPLSQVTLILRLARGRAH